MSESPLEILITKVEAIDKDAALYLKELPGDYIQEIGYLDLLFVWSESPQGYTYWQNIFIQLGAI